MGAIEQLPDAVRFPDQRSRLLMLELEFAMTFVDIARVTPIPESQAKNLDSAWKAYCSICEMVAEGAHCSAEDQARVDRMSDALGRTLLGWLKPAS